MSVSIMSCDGGLEEIESETREAMSVSICDAVPKTREDCNMKAVKIFPNYFYTDNGQLFGIDSKTPERIEPIDQDGDLVDISDFFLKVEKSENVLYFSVNELVDEKMTVKFYKQLCGEISSVKTIPSAPVPARSKLKSENFTIEDFDYQGKACSDVKNRKTESGVERFFMVDGYVLIDGGLVYNVSDGRYNDTIVVRKAGLYFWDAGKQTGQMVKDKGVFY